MSTNMTLIETKTVGAGGASNITFTSIPGTYTDLKVVLSVRNTNASVVDNSVIAFNGSATSKTQRTLLTNVTSSPTSYNYTEFYMWQPAANSTSSTFGNIEIYIPNYTSSNNKSFSLDGVTENNGTETYLYMNAGLWSNSAAITSISFTPAAGTYVEGSTATLYGISAITSTPKATGGIVSQDATYWYHMFPFSSSFTPVSALSADILCIAGGGGGGGNWGGGGGAGGLLGFTSQSLTATGYTVQVGAGGTGGNATFGAVGGDSQFGALTLVKGGGLGGYGAVGGNGGSGGGGGYGYAGGSLTSSQGNNGGSGTTGTVYSTGGGGGAGGAGGNSSGGTSGSGGIGVSTYSSWGLATFTGQISGSTAYFAGGGGGGGRTVNSNISGAGGLGGGGAGGASGGSTGISNGTAGIVNTGGGGGGSLSDGSSGLVGGNGGSGVVIVRYAK